MKNLIDTVQWKGFFRCWNNKGYSTYDLKQAEKRGDRLEDLEYLEFDRECPNLIMASQKLLMAQAVFPNIDRMVVTNQISAPVDSETSYSGTIYTTVDADETSRSGNSNPYQIKWNIISDSANGSWGSFILITNTGAMINRALANVQKVAGQAKLIEFTGQVV